MNGFYFSSDSALNVLNEDGKILHCTIAGRSRQDSGITRLYIEGGRVKDGSVIAFSEGGMHNKSYRRWRVGGNNREGFSVVIMSKGNAPVDVYVFEPYDGEVQSSSNYGVQIFNKAGKLSYHDSLKTLKVLGHFSKNNPNPVWYFPDRVVGRKLAFIQLGGDFSHYGYGIGGGYLETMSYVEKGLDLDKNTEIIKKIHKNEAVWGSDALAGNMKVERKNEDIFYTIIDVTDIPTATYPSDYYPPMAFE